jgi:hypothetical protein
VGGDPSPRQLAIIFKCEVSIGKQPRNSPIWWRLRTAATVPVEMPFTGEVLGYLPTADEHDVELTVTRANSANPLGAGVVP